MNVSTRPNVFVLTVDSLQYDVFEQAAARIAERVGGVEFTDAVAPASHTASAMPALATGVYHDSFQSRQLPDSEPPNTLATELSAVGYDCGLWTENVLFSEQYNYDGFDGGNLGRPSTKRRLASVIDALGIERLSATGRWAYYRLYKPLVEGISGGKRGDFYRPAAAWHEDVMAWLDRTERPQLCWTHYMDTHHPYEPPADRFESLSLDGDHTRTELGELTRTAASNGRLPEPASLRDVRAAYRACCDQLAEDLLEFIDSLIRSGHFVPGRDVFVLTADHGEILSPSEHGMIGHTPPAFWEELIHVPLVLARPNWRQETVDRQVSLVDLVPTILDAVGVTPSGTLDGTAGSDPRALSRDVALSVSQPYVGDGSQRTYRSARSADGWKLFGLSHQTDQPDETVLTRRDDDGEHVLWRGPVAESPLEALSEEARQAHRRLRSVLDERGGPVEVAADTESTAETSPEEMEDHLRDLGYLE